MATTLENLITTYRIPINIRNLINLAHRFRTNMYPIHLGERPNFTHFLRECGIQISTISSVIDMQLQKTAFQVEYTNATVTYTIILMIPSVIIVSITSFFLSPIALIESILTQIVVESVFSVITGWLSALIVDDFAQKEIRLKNTEFDEDKYGSELKELTHQSWVAGALGGLFGYITFGLHNGFLNHLGTLVSSASNVAASVETSLLPIHS